MNAEKGKSRLARWARRLVALAVLVALVASFPAHWGPWLARKVVCAFLPHGAGFENQIDIRRVSLFGVEVGETVLGGLPTRPSFSSAQVVFSPVGLMSKRIDAIRVEGVAFTPDYKVPNFSMATSAHAGSRVVAQDPLQGWTFKSVSLAMPGTDLAAVVPPEARRFIRSTMLDARLTLELGDAAYMGRIEGHALGGTLEGKVGYSQKDGKGNVAMVYSPNLSGILPPGDTSLAVDFAVLAEDGYRVMGDGSLSVGETAMDAGFKFDLSPNGSAVKASIMRREVTEANALVRTVMSLPEIAEAGAAADVSFHAKANALLSVGVTNGLANWTLIANLRDGGATMKAGDVPVSLGGLSAGVTVRGYGAHFDIEPIPVAFTNATFGTISLDSGRARLISDTRSLLISEASVGFCGGHLRLYSLNLDYERLSAGFTVFIDGIEVEPFFKMFPKLTSCSATGRLYGRLPMFIMGGGEKFRFGNGFLYTPPGDTGHLRLEDDAQVRELLRSSGLPGEIAKDLATALRDLEYDILRFDLSRGAGGDEDGKLAIRIRGESRVGKAVTPVDVNVSVNGALERAIDLALKAARTRL